MQKILENKPFIFLLSVISLIIIMTIVNKEETIHLELSDSVYSGEWKALHNRSNAIVSIRDEHSYDIRYSNVACKMVFVGTIYRIDIEDHLFKILKLDIDKSQSECYFLNSFFAPSKFIFKFEALAPEYAKLKLPSVDDLELYLKHAEGSDAVKSNLESMIKMLKTKSTMLQKAEHVTLEYEKRALP
jgi:hypothetical protein